MTDKLAARPEWENMTTTVKKKAKDRRAEIISAAQAILANEGAGALTLRAIANEVGIKLASLQYHFPTYAALVEAMADKTVETYSEGLRLETEADASPEMKLEQALEWFAGPSAPTSDLSKLELQFWALAQTNTDARAALRRYHDTYIEYFEKLIADARPRYTPAQIRAKTISIVSLFEGSVLFVDLVDDYKTRVSRARDILRTARTILDFE